MAHYSGAAPATGLGHHLHTDLGLPLSNFYPFDKNRVFGYFQSEVILTEPGGISIANQLIEGMRVQFEGNLGLKCQSASRSRRTPPHYDKFESLIRGSYQSEEQGSFSYTPMFIQYTPSEGTPTSTELLSIPTGTHTFRFKIPFSDENLPAPFENNYGSLQYRVVAYLRHPHAFIQIGSQVVNFRGNLNLYRLPSLSEPLSSQISLQSARSICPSSKDFTASFIVKDPLPGKQGFIPGESIVFAIIITNPRSLPTKDFSVFLMRKTTYGLRKRTEVAELPFGKFEVQEETKEKNIKWEGSIVVPATCGPTYEEKSIYHVTYSLQYEVVVHEEWTSYPKTLQGKVKVVIGTHRMIPASIAAPIREPMVVSSSGAPAVAVRSRSMSAMPRSTFNPRSIVNTRATWAPRSTLETPPPSYSQLSSRSTSYATLPPHYDDVVKEHQN